MTNRILVVADIGLRQLLTALRWLVLPPLLGLAFCCQGTDWPQYRGPTHDGISTDHINQQWSGSVSTPVWQVALPSSIGSFTVSGGRAFTQIRRTVGGVDKEVCVALDITSGAELWATAVENAYYPDGQTGGADGPRSTPVVDGGSVYVLTTWLKLYRLDATTGAVIWQKDLVALYGGGLIAWQNAASPLIEGGLIYVAAACGSQNLMALNTSNGSLAWRAEYESMTHSTPVLATIQGVRQVIFAAQSGLVSLNPLTGSRLWKYSYPFYYSTSLAISPVVYQDMVFISGAYGMGSAVVRVALTGGSWTTTKLWNDNWSSQNQWMTPVCYQGYLYGQFGTAVSTPYLDCIDMQTGEIKWSVYGFGLGGTLLVDNHLLILTADGNLVLAEPNSTAYTEVARFQAIPGYSSANRCWNSPAVADGRVYVRSTAYGACFDLSVNVSPPSLALSPTVLNFSAVQGASPTSQSFRVSNSGGSTLNWAAVADPAAPAWLSVTPSNGANSAMLTVSAASASLAPGTYSKYITVTAAGVTNSPQTVLVNLVVNVTAVTHYDFTYPDRATLLAGGWDFLARTASGATRNTEQTTGAVPSYDQAVHPGVLRIPADTGDLWAALNNTRNSLFRNLPTNWLSLRLKLSFSPTQSTQQAGLALYQDDDNYLVLDRVYNGGNKVSYSREPGGSPTTVNSVGETATTNLVMRLDRDDASGTISACYSLDGTNWVALGNATQTISNPRLGIFVGGSPSGYPNADLAWAEVIAPQAPLVLAVGPASLDLGFLQAGTCASGTFYVTNLSGGALTGSVSGATAPFSLVSGGNYSLSSNAWQTVVVQYCPTVAGSNNLNLTFAGGSGASRPVTGSAYPKPFLTLDPPWPAPGNQFELTFRTANGTPIDSNRLAGIEVRASTDLALSQSAWPKLTNSLLLTNGAVRVLNVDGGPSRQYFILREPQ